MKILLVVPDTNIGGITSSVINFANELSSRGNKIFFLDMSNEYLFRDRLNQEVTIGELSGKSKLWNISASLMSKSHGLKKLFFFILGILKKLTIKSGLWFNLIFSSYKEFGELDVAIAFRQCAPCYSFVLNKVKAKKKIGFVHGELKYMGDISSWQKYMEQFDKIAYVSNAVKEEFIEAYPQLKNNACTIYNMFDIEQIKSLAQEPPEIIFDKSKINIVTVARIDNEFKQIHWIIEICEKLKKTTDTPFHWYVVGDGPDYESTISLAIVRNVTDVLTFTGKQDNPHTFVNQCDFTVLASKSEAYPMVVNESFVLGKPVISTRFRSINELIEDENNGLIAEQSIEILVEKISDMINNKNGIREKCYQYLTKNSITNEVPLSQFLKALEC